MTQNTTNLITQTIGLDLGDKRSVAIVLTTRPVCRIALEVGTHSAWIAEQLTGYGQTASLIGLRYICVTRDRLTRCHPPPTSFSPRLLGASMAPILEKGRPAEHVFPVIGGSVYYLLA